MPQESLQPDQSYYETFLQYCQNHSEQTLYEASLLSARLIRLGFGPDDIVAMHIDAVQKASTANALPASDRLRVLNDAHQFLLEVMIGYGAHYKEFVDLRLEAATRRAEEAERSEQEKLEMLAMIAHELGNPMTIAQGNLQLLPRLLDSGDLQNVYDLIGDSRTALARLSNLTQQILAASRSEDVALELEQVDICQAVRALEEWGRDTAATKGIVFSVSLPAQAISIIGNQDALQSILSNLISNALRYTMDAGSVSVTVTRDMAGTRLEVSDTGIGMSRVDVAKAADKFFRGAEAKKIASGGLGMGLAITNGLVKAQGGHLEIESELGKGSKFAAVFPALEEGD